LQIKLNKLAYLLFGCAILLIIIVFGAHKFRITNEVVLYAIATAIAIIPESLVAVLTLTMAVGTRRMAREHVIVRKLDALESLGGVTDICSDKTGTLTLGMFPSFDSVEGNINVVFPGKMSVRKFWLGGESSHASELVAEVQQDALNPSGAVTRAEDNQVVDPKNLNEGLAQAIRAIALCNIATYVFSIVLTLSSPNHVL
jgi:P-type Na+/K+ transporter